LEKKVNKELKKNYKKIFNLIDKLIFLKVPSFKYVFKWRLLQEKKLRINLKEKKLCLINQIKNFIMFYERITKHMLKISKKS
jgi:D-glycerate 3-kinase